MPIDRATIDRLEQLGEDAVRRDVMAGLAGSKGSEHNDAVLVWLANKAAARLAATEASYAERQASLATEANRIASSQLAAAVKSAEASSDSARSAREQARWAKWAAIIAVIAAAISTKDQILEFIFHP